MRIRLDLDIETTKRLVAIALEERRSACDQAQVLLEEILGVRPGSMWRAESCVGEGVSAEKSEP
jgi:hypothetical protein